ncbi:MAG: hypothetical protein ABI947_28280 [Chloroflexota bacterium]
MSKLTVKVIICLIAITTVTTACSGSQPLVPTRVSTSAISTIASTQAIAGSCSKTVTTALETVKGSCNDIGANQVCYGNPKLDVTTTNTVTFNAPGDLVNLADLKTIHTNAYNEGAGTWGIAVMRAAVNLPGTTAGQQVTFVMYGDTTLDSVNAAMTTIAFHTGIGKQACDELPPSGLVVQVPRGQKIKFTANGADISLGSTAVLQAEPDKQFVISVLQGQGEVTAQGITQTVSEGYQTHVPLKGTTAAAAPDAPRPIPFQDVSAAPTYLLQQPITKAQIQQVISNATAQIGQTNTPNATQPGSSTPQASVTPLLTWTPGPTLPPVSGAQKRIAFASNRDGNFEIYAMNADGSSAVRLTNRADDDRSPTWSPDGKQIAYAAFTGKTLQIYRVNADASNPTALTPLNNSADHPAWSPDGKLIAYDVLQNNNRDLWVINIDGSGAKAITNNPADDSQPAWSPDGKQITFASSRDGNKEIYTMNADGSAVVRLTSNPADDSQPAWSPDGKQIAFASTRSGNGDIYVMNGDGSAVKRIIGNAAVESSPVWSPDGGQLAFVSNREGTQAIYVVNTSGEGDPRRLTDLSADNSNPAWQH